MRQQKNKGSKNKRGNGKKKEWEMNKLNFFRSKIHSDGLEIPNLYGN